MKIEITRLNTSFKIRSIKENGIEALIKKLETGFLDSFPITVDEDMTVIDGHHRVEAAKRLGIHTVPYIVKEGLTDSEKTHLAFMANEASETSVPMTMVDYCEFIWKSEDKLADIAVQLGWSESKVKRYSALSKVHQTAWDIVVHSFVEVNQESPLVNFFNVKILEPITKLTEPQQLQLVTDLANETINKNKFKALAEKYKAQNEDIEALTKELEGNVTEDLLKEAILEVETGNYDLDKLIQLTKDKHDKKTSIKLIHGDFYEEVAKVSDGSVDLIVTDPPYNIAHENEAVYEDRKNVSKDFGEWDKVEHSEFKEMAVSWVKEFKRILKPNGAGYIFTSDVYLSHLREYIEAEGLRYRATLIWHKTNPGTSPTKGNYISSNEYIVYFDMGEKPTFNWMGDNEMVNFIQSGICGGNERIKDSKSNTLHPTQKPKSVIRHLVDISSNKGDTVFDGFMGSGTTAEVAKDTDRRFIGIEMDEKYFDAAKKRSL